VAWARFSRNVEYRRPGRNIAFSVVAHPQPQRAPRDVVAHAVQLGAAVEVEGMTRTDVAASGNVNGVEAIRARRAPMRRK
jgi:hypothetical protein